MPCKACHKPKVKELVVGNRYKGPHGDYIFSEVSDTEYAFVNLASGITWSGYKKLEDTHKEDAHLFKEIRRN